MDMRETTADHRTDLPANVPNGNTKGHALRLANGMPALKRSSCAHLCIRATKEPH